MRNAKFAALGTVAVLLIASLLLAAGGQILRIVIVGGDLETPIEIADESVTQFSFYEGPRTTTRVTQSMNVDWSRGIAVPPKGAPIYNVSFVTAHKNPSTFVVRYAIDPATDHGYVYLPGKGGPGVSSQYLVDCSPGGRQLVSCMEQVGEIRKPADCQGKKNPLIRPQD